MSARLPIAKPSDIGAASLSEANTFTEAMSITTGYLHLLDERSDANAPEMHWVGRRSTWLWGIDVADAVPSRDFVLGKATKYTIFDAVTTLGSATLTSALEGNFRVGAVGTLTGAGIPAGTTILSVQSATSLTMSAEATANSSGVGVVINGPGVYDYLYIRHNGGGMPTIGLGEPSDNTAVLQVLAGPPSDPAMNGLKLQQGPGATGHYLDVRNSANTPLLWLDKDCVWHGNHASYGSSLTVAGSVGNQALALCDKTGSASSVFAFEYYDATTLQFRHRNTGLTLFQFLGGSLSVKATSLGFYGANPIAKPTITGARNNPEGALKSLIDALWTMGLITGATTAT